MQMRLGLGMDDNQVGPRIGKGLHVARRRLRHDVHVEEELPAHLAQGFDDGLAKGDVGRKGAVDDVKVEPLDARFFEFLADGSKPGKVGREERWRERTGRLLAV